jgi:predicted metal-dependent hydrolase
VSLSVTGALQGELFQARSVPIEIRESARVRRLNVRVYPGGRVAVSVPKGTRPTIVEDFLRKHRDWIAQKVTQFTVVEEAALPATIDLPSTGDQWVVHYRVGRSSFRIIADRALEIRHPPQDRDGAQRALASWAIAEARRSLEPWFADIATEMEVSYRDVQWRRQRTRWGSCSRSGTISLNVAILFQPPDVARYLFVHELAHTRHMNHSARFWSFVARHEPEYRALDRQLAEGWRRVPGWLTAGSAS